MGNRMITLAWALDDRGDFFLGTSACGMARANVADNKSYVSAGASLVTGAVARYDPVDAQVASLGTGREPARLCQEDSRPLPTAAHCKQGKVLHTAGEQLAPSASPSMPP